MNIDDDTSFYVVFHNGVLHPPSKQVIEWLKQEKLEFVTTIFIGDNIERKKWLLNNSKSLVIYPRNLPVLVIANGETKREVVDTDRIQETLKTLFIDNFKDSNESNPPLGN